MTYVIMLFPLNVLTMYRLDRYHLKLAEYFHAVLFAIMSVSAFLLYGGVPCDYVTDFFHITDSIVSLRESIGAEGLAFLAPFMILESVCYALAVYVFTELTFAVTVEVIRRIRAAFRAWWQTRKLFGTPVAVPQLPPMKIYRMNCVMRC